MIVVLLCSASTPADALIWRITLSAPLFRLVTYGLVRACVTADDKLQALPHLRQCLVFHIRCSFSRRENAEMLVHSAFCKQNYPIRSLAHFHAAGDEGKALVCKGCFRVLHPNESVSGVGGESRESVVLKRVIGCTSRGECCSPSFPSGFPPPLGKSAVLLKCGICFSSFLIKFELA